MQRLCSIMNTFMPSDLGRMIRLSVLLNGLGLGVLLQSMPRNLQKIFGGKELFGCGSVPHANVIIHARNHPKVGTDAGSVPLCLSTVLTQFKSERNHH